MTGEERKEMIGETIYIDGAKESVDLWLCQGAPTGSSPLALPLHSLVDVA